MFFLNTCKVTPVKFQVAVSQASPRKQVIFQKYFQMLLHAAVKIDYNNPQIHVHSPYHAFIGDIHYIGGSNITAKKIYWEKMTRKTNFVAFPAI